MKDEPPPLLDATLLRADYERLRADALTGGGQSWRWGRSLLARGGLAAWIKAWSEHAAANVNRYQPTRSLAPVTSTVDTEPLVPALAQLLLARTRGSPESAVAS